MPAPSSTPPPATATDRPRRSLKALLTSADTFANTRLAACMRRQAPLEQTKLALLLMTCGYKVRLNGDGVDVFASAWVPALLPRVGETVLGYVSKQCSLVRPVGLMDPDDARLESVFVPQ